MKQIKDTQTIKWSESVAIGNRITVRTDDDTIYVFWDLKWRELPVFSHRLFKENGNTRRASIHNDPLPEKVDQYMIENHGGYTMGEGRLMFRIGTGEYGMTVEEDPRKERPPLFK